jgi:hypothetical protein
MMVETLPQRRNRGPRYAPAFARSGVRRRGESLASLKGWVSCKKEAEPRRGGTQGGLLSETAVRLK